MDGTNFTLAISSLCLVLHSVPARDVPSRAVSEEACTPLIDDAHRPIDNPHSDMTLLVLRLASTTLADSSTVLNLSDIYAQDQYLGFSK
jgi:hypothetical protein